MKESDLKRSVYEYLLILENQGKLWFERLNSGEAYKRYKDKSHRIVLCRKGTSDFIVVLYDFWGNDVVEVCFLECKSDKGKQSGEQKYFEDKVTEQGAEYYIIRSVDEVKEILGELH